MGFLKSLCCLLILIYAVEALTPEEERQRDARFVAVQSYITELAFTTSTTTISDTCYTSIATNACRRRSLRRSLRLLDVEADPAFSLDEVAGSMGTGEPLDKEVDARSPRLLALTVWSSTTSTYTMLMTSTNTATKYSVSFYCSVVGGNFPPLCTG